ncbi:MAG: DUF2182 domain-containing protein [Paracoccaceae bacterium]
MSAAAPSPVEAALRREAWITGAALALLSVLAWAWTLAGAGMGMDAFAMTRLALFPHLGAASGGMGAMADTGGGGLGHALLLLSMWWVMMVAMMVPAAAPTILLYARTVRRQVARGRMSGRAGTGAFLGGYLAAWLGFSVAAAGLQLGLEAAGLLRPMLMSGNDARFAAAVLAAAGLWQLSPLKAVCLAHCRSPADWLSRHWRPGPAGAFRMGVEHGVFCVGCCWALMALLFVGGVMNVVWIAALTLLVAVEKIAPAGPFVGYAVAALLLLWSVATLLV